MITFKQLLLQNSINKTTLLLNYYTQLELDEVDLSIILHIEALLSINSLVTSKVLEDRMSISKLKIDRKLEQLIKRGFIAIDNYAYNNLVDTSLIYDKINNIIIGQQLSINKNQDVVNQESILDLFSKEFKAQLTPMQREVISDWIEHYSSELIIYALKEAVSQGIVKMKYIEKIIIEQNRLLNGS
ncbi:MAG: DnaD domain-containing protein [Bacilli bacterium]